MGVAPANGVRRVVEVQPAPYRQSPNPLSGAGFSVLKNENGWLGATRRLRRGAADLDRVRVVYQRSSRMLRVWEQDDGQFAAITFPFPVVTELASCTPRDMGTEVRIGDVDDWQVSRGPHLIPGSKFSHLQHGTSCCAIG